MIPISSWYPALGQFSFPTVFVELRNEEIKALLAEDAATPPALAAIARIQQAIRDLPGSSFIGSDVCAPTDSDNFGNGRVSYGKVAWRILSTSSKVTEAIRQGTTRRITVRPFRRMNKMREFRAFFKNRDLIGMSQYHLAEGHLSKLLKRDKDIWRKARKFAARIAEFLPLDDVVVDLYLTSDDRLLIVDLNSWGPPTDPLLFKTWDRNWEDAPELKLIPAPVKMKGEVSVSF